MRTIVHLDADAYYASVEQSADARLRGKPVAVGGERRGIIASASYEARQFGIYTPMPTARARKLCPRLIVLPGDYERYEQFSDWMFGVAYDFTPAVERTSVDEGYFDLTANHSRPAVEIARTISQAIRQSLKITVSEGLGSNKLVAAIGSKLYKPAGFQVVPPGREQLFLHPLPARWLPGIGPQTAARLCAAGLAEIGQIAATPVDLLGLLLGRQAPLVRQFAHGIDERPLIPASEPQKSFSQQETFNEDVTDEEYVGAVLRRMADKLFAAVRAEQRSVRTLTVKVRYNDRDENQRAASLTEPTDLETDVYGRLQGLLREAWQRRVSLRLVSLKLSNVYDGVFRSELPLETGARNHAARERLAAAVDDLRRSRGWSVVVRGHDLRLRDAPRDLANERAACAPERGLQPADARPPSALRRTDPPITDHRLPSLAPWDGPAYPTGAALRPPSSALAPDSLSASTGERAGVRCRASEASSALRHPASGIRPPSPLFVPLRVRSHYTFLDSTLSPAAIVALARQHELPAIALTDLGNLHGAVEFAQAARQAGIKPIFGTELTVNGQPLLLYVESARGYRHLNRLLSARAQAGDDEDSVAAQQRRPLTRELLAGCADGLIAVGTDPGLAELFPGRFYQLATKAHLHSVSATLAPAGGEARVSGPHHPDHSLAPLGGEGRVRGFPVVACPAIHYALPSDRLKYDILQSIRTRTLLRQAHPDKRLAGRFHFRAPAELAAACQDHPEWLAHSRELAERCRFDLPFGPPQFPDFQTPDGSTPRAFLHRLVTAGLRTRYRARAAQFAAQAEEELSIIAAVGYESYFLLTWSLLQECRQQGIEWITRGSAADSLVCYCLGISGVCPIRFDLYFKRFLNPERMALHKLPDIDVDFPHDRKDDVVKLIFDRYGAEACAVVGGFSTFKARSAFADVAKVLGVSERDVRQFTDHFPWSFGGGWVPDEPTPRGGTHLRDLLAASPENRDLPLDEEPFKTALDMAEFLDGTPRYPKMHPCGVVLSRQPMHELTPTFVSSKGYPTTHFDMDAVEAIGLVKMDILAQGGLAVMRDAQASLAARGIEVDLETLAPWQDERVWDMIASGGARAVHHIESPAMTALCRQCHVQDMDTLIAIVSVIRPGAANEGKKLAFTRRYQGLEPITYPHPSLEPCLRSTFGLVVYEEHILQICEAFAGMPPGRADVLRRALVKQKRAVVQEIGREFAASARARGHDEPKIAEVWGLVTGFSGYAFCKAHSTAYGVEAYQAAWLKRYYPAEFLAGVLTHGKGFYDPLVYVLECHRLGIHFLPPSVNEPGPAFQVVTGERARPRVPDAATRRVQTPDQPDRNGDRPVAWVGDGQRGTRDAPASPCIRIPLTRAKGLTGRTTERLLAERQRAPFTSLADFHRRVQPLPEDTAILIRAGGFDEFGQPRTRQFWEAQQLPPSGLHPPASALATGNLEFAFDAGVSPVSAFLDQHPTLLHEPARRERLAAEAELYGYPVSGHPLELFADVAWDTYCPVARLGEHLGETVVTCGLVVEQRTHHQITGEPMKFLTLADWTGLVETDLFAQTYRRYGLATVRYPVLEVTATVEPFENGRGFSLRVLRAGQPRSQ